MPYDEQGNFVYPTPARKAASKKGGKAAKQAASPAKPRPAKAIESATEVEVAGGKLAPSFRVELKAENEATPINNTSAALAFSNKPEPVITIALSPIEPVLPDNEIKNITELDLALLWNAQKWPSETKPGLRTQAGQTIEVIYRGRWSGGFGPDFKGAILNMNGELKQGDVELHLKTSGWKAHGHQHDPRYNQVILQVVLEDDKPDIALTEQGQHLPTLALLPLFKNVAQLQQAIDTVQTRLGTISESDGPCCERVAERQPELEKLLVEIDDLGQERFSEKAGRYEADCAAGLEGGPAQLFWAGLLEALGYSQNKSSFRRLAEVLPLANILEIERSGRKRAEPYEERLLNLEAVLLGAAGLLPTQRRPRKTSNSDNGQRSLFPNAPAVEPLEDWAAGFYVEELERRWDWLERQIRAGTGTFATMSEKEWTFARLRPPNHPTRRIAGLARWLAALPASTEADLLTWLTDKLANPSAEEACRQLVTTFRVGLDDKESESGQFWTRRFDFAPRALMVGENAKGATVDLVGPDRAAEIVVNIALPFLYGYACYEDDTPLQQQALAAYRVQPRPGTNELVEKIAGQVFGYWLTKPGEIVLRGKVIKKLTAGRLIDTACRQQGLIYLHHHYCTSQDYASCPLRFAN